MKGQVCEAGTIMTCFQVCSLCVCLHLDDLEWSWCYNVVVDGRNRLRKRVGIVISALKLLMSV